MRADDSADPAPDRFKTIPATSLDSRLSLADLISRPPKVHASRSITWGIDPRLAGFLDGHLHTGHVTLETGSGLSTLVILRKGVTRHIAIAPAADEFVVLREFCSENGISAAPLEAVSKTSQEYLPIAPLPALDLVLVDGDHAFPSPFIDWYYTADRLVVGGMMVVDDIQLITGRLLADFMDADPKWERVCYEPSRFAVYRKLCHPISGGRWDDQPYVASTNPVKHVSITRAEPEVRREPGPSGRALRALYARLPAGAQALYRRVRHVVTRERRES
jgi:hypothetical protein